MSQEKKTPAQGRALAGCFAGSGHPFGAASVAPWGLRGALILNIHNWKALSHPTCGLIDVSVKEHYRGKPQSG
jgi:hypothetical protein